MLKHIPFIVFLWLSLFLFWTLPIFAQEVDTAWVRRYNGTGNATDWANDIAVDGSGNVYLTGYSWGGYNDYATVKYSSSGSVLWAKRYSGLVGNYDDGAEAIAIDIAGNVYVTGGSYGGVATACDYATIKYNSNGDTVWVRRYNGPGNGDDYAQSIAVDTSGNVYVTGESPGSGTYRDYATVKYKPNGDTAWVRRYNGLGNGPDGATALVADNSGNAYVTGWSYSGSSPGADYVTIKYKSNGDTAWVRRYNGPVSSGDFAYALAIDGSGNVYVTGQSPGGLTYTDYATVKYDSAGNQRWVKRYDGPVSSDDWGNAITVGDSGYVYVTGRSTGSGTSYDYATIKYDSSGNQKWASRYTGPGSSTDEGRDIATDDSGNVYVTGTSYGDTTANYDYATIKYDPLGNQRWVKIYNGATNTDDEAYAIALDSYYDVYVTGGGSDDYLTIKYVQGGGEKKLVLKDGSASHNLIANQTFKISKVTNNPPTMSETYMGELATDGNGKASVPSGWFNVGDWVKVEKLIDTEAAVKHKTILPNMYYIKVDNGEFDAATGAISYHSFTSDAEQEITVDHTSLMFDLLVSVEWDADQQFLNSLRDGFKLMSNYLYDLTDGQLYLDSIKIYDAKVNWDSADVRIHASNMQWPCATVFFYKDGTPYRLGGGIFGAGNARLFFPRIFYFNNKDANRNLTYDLYPYNWSIAQTSYNSVSKAYPPSRTLAHEFGHYGIGFYDEYCDAGNTYLFPDGNGNNPFDFGLMDDQLGVGVAQNSEMSCASQYVDLSHRVIAQWTERGDRSCWDYFQWNYEDSYSGGIFAPIKNPSLLTFSGPNDDIGNLNYDVGSLLKPVIVDANEYAYMLIVISTDILGNPLGNSNVEIYKKNGTLLLDQGNTSDSGKIRCLGVNDHDMLRTYRVKNDSVVEYSEIEVGTTLSLGRFITPYRISADGDTLIVTLREISGHYPLLSRVWFETENSFKYSIRTSKSFSQNPSLEFYPSYDQTYNYDFYPVTGGYEAAFADSLGSGGSFSVVAVDDSAHNFFTNAKYTLSDLSDTLSGSKIYGPEGACELILDKSNTLLEKILILSSDYPPLLDGVDSSKRTGAVHSISAYPNTSGLSGTDNHLIIRYSDNNLTSTSEAELNIFRWDDSQAKWEFVGGNVDTAANEVAVSIHSLGTYAVFTAKLMRGDANGDSKITVSDVIYIINYLFKGGPAPVPIQSADVNCDGKVTVSDVIYLINYLFKGGPSPC